MGQDKIWAFSDAALANVDFYRQVAGSPLSIDEPPADSTPADSA